VHQHVEINIHNDVIPYKRGYSTGVLSHREGREGKERMMKPVWLRLEPKWIHQLTYSP